MTRSNPSISDDMLSAYLDGMLDEADVRALETALEKDAALGRRLARMARNDRALKRRFQEAARRPVPDAISAMLEPEPRPARSWWSGLAARLSSWQASPAPLQAAGGLAALAFVGAGVLAIWNVDTLTDSAEDAALVRALPSTSAEVTRLLDRRPSGDVVVLGGTARAVVDMTFEHADGRYCRQYRVALEAGHSSLAAIACRSGSGWREELFQRIDAPVVEPGVFRAAGARATSLLDGYILEQANGEIVIGQPEAELIERNWSTP